MTVFSSPACSELSSFGGGFCGGIWDSCVGKVACFLVPVLVVGRGARAPVLPVVLLIVIAVRDGVVLVVVDRFCPVQWPRWFVHHDSGFMCSFQGKFPVLPTLSVGAS